MDNNTILVIDDDRNILAIIELYLKKAGFTVVTCADGLSALPVFGGHLSIRSVGSEMHGDAQMGVLCCSPPATTALRAYVDDRVAAVAHVVAGGVVDSPPAGGPVRSVAVLDWRYCAGGRCTTTPVAGSDPDG
mgnify:CR=1 FL=1